MIDQNQMLRIAVETGPPTVVRFGGQADFHNRQRICEALDSVLQEGDVLVQVDLSELCYMDSSALSALILCADKAGRAGGTIELIGVSDQVARLLTLVGAAALFGSTVHDIPVCRTDEPADGGNPWHVSDFTLPASPHAAASARSRIAHLVESLDISSDDEQDILIAVGEALANAIKHGCGCDPERKISVKCVAGHSRLAIDVTDPGAGFDPDSTAAPSPSAMTEGGMGIHMMRQLMDEVSFDFNGRTTIRLVKQIHRPTDPPQTIEP